MNKHLPLSIFFLYHIYSYTFQTVVLKGLGKDITKKHIYKKVRKVGDVKEVIYPVIAQPSESSTAEAKSEAIEEGTGTMYSVERSESVLFNLSKGLTC
jgi:hypothetical protein